VCLSRPCSMCLDRERQRSCSLLPPNRLRNRMLACWALDPDSPRARVSQSVSLNRTRCTSIAPAMLDRSDPLKLARRPLARCYPLSFADHVVDSRCSQSLGCVTTRPRQSIHRLPSTAYSSPSLHSLARISWSPLLQHCPAREPFRSFPCVGALPPPGNWPCAF
jgi:hypothetical protein